MDRYEACRTCKKRCCVNCAHFECALAFLPGQLVNITCSAQPDEKLNHNTGNLTEEECQFHEIDNDLKIITKAIEGAV